MNILGAIIILLQLGLTVYFLRSKRDSDKLISAAINTIMLFFWVWGWPALGGH